MVIKLRETIMILDLRQQGLTVSAISGETDIDARRCANTLRVALRLRPSVPASRERRGIENGSALAVRPLQQACCQLRLSR